MAKTSSAAQGFIGSLVLLVVALVVFFLVLYPRGKKPEPEVKTAATVAATATRQTPAHQTERDPPPLNEGSRHAATEAARPAQAKAGDTAAGGEDPDIQKAINLIDNGNVTEAVTLLEGVLKRDPNSEQALVEMAMLNLLDLKQPEQATYYLQRVMEVNPQNQIVMAELVSLYEEQGKVDDGLNFLISIQEKSPASTEVAYGIGQLMSLQGRDSEAIAYLEKAAQAPDNQIRAFRDLGEAYARSGDPDKAIDSFSKSVTQQEAEVSDKRQRGLPVQFAEERLAYTKMDMARELLRRGDTEQAQQLLDEAKVIMPTDQAVNSLQNSINRKKAG